MAKLKNLIIDQGSTFSHTETYTDIIGTPIDLTGNTFYGQIRKSVWSSTISSTFTIVSPTPVNGQYTISLSDEQTQLLKPGRYQYDILIEDGVGVRKRILEGLITVTGAVTVI